MIGESSRVEQIDECNTTHPSTCKSFTQRFSSAQGEFVNKIPGRLNRIVQWAAPIRFLLGSFLTHSTVKIVISRPNRNSNSTTIVYRLIRRTCGDRMKCVDAVSPYRVGRRHMPQTRGNRTSTELETYLVLFTHDLEHERRRESLSSITCHLRQFDGTEFEIQHFILTTIRDSPFMLACQTSQQNANWNALGNGVCCSNEWHFTKHTPAHAGQAAGPSETLGQARKQYLASTHTHTHGANAHLLITCRIEPCEWERTAWIIESKSDSAHSHHRT